MTQIAVGKWYPQSLLESLLTFRINKVVENIFVPTLLHACFLVEDDNSTGDAFMMCVAVFSGPVLPDVQTITGQMQSFTFVYKKLNWLWH